jgi:hypothetical protein
VPATVGAGRRLRSARSRRAGRSLLG